MSATFHALVPASPFTEIRHGAFIENNGSHYTRFPVSQEANFAPWREIANEIMLERMANCFTRPCLLALACTLVVAAHDIPNDVTVQAFLKPSGDKLYLVVRAPLKSMRDVDFPDGPDGYLDLEATRPLLADAAHVWIGEFVKIYENGKLLTQDPRIVATQLSVQGDRSFVSFNQAFEHITGPPLPDSTKLAWDQPDMDVILEYPIHSEHSRFSIQPDGLWRLGVNVLTVLRFVFPNGVVRAMEFTDLPGLVYMDPQWYQAALRFVHMGFLHILDGTDHLLFLFCLVIPFRKFRALIPVVTSFTIAHSITLIASAYNLAPDVLWFPPLIETLIAVSIVYMALENIVGAGTVHKRWMIAFGFGLVHGFGFSFALRQTLQFAGDHMLTSLLSFNIGVELGQLMVLLIMIPALDLLFARVVTERMGTIILSAIVAHTAWHWMIDRYDVLSRFHIRYDLPTLTDASLANAMRWMMLLVAAGGLFWLWYAVLKPRGAAKATADPDSRTT